MVNNGAIIGGSVAGVAIIFALFISLNSVSENSESSFTVTNGDHLEKFGDVTVGSNMSLIQLFEKAEPAVIQVNVKKIQSEGATEEVPGGSGSGFVYDDTGHIITNNHVIDDALKITVTFLDGESYAAEIVGNDADLDLAVLKINARNSYLHHLELGSSSELKVGQQVVAIGNPFGLSGSMTTGIVSQIGRLLPQESGYSIPNVIQTDAAINPGNSGGPLLNLNGEVVGINTAIQSETGNFTGVGFAIPSDTVNKVVPILIRDGGIRHPWLGVSGIDIDYELAQIRGLDSTKGFLIVSVIEGSPADIAGLMGTETREMIDGRDVPMDGDIIIKIDGELVRKIADILVHLQMEKLVGDEMVLTILRDGEVMDKTIFLGERPSN
jgi:S1-C subfamily serine protease|tara:strand:+ start:79 stop:1224 length:1146 start_codon:yes stop_codon:yes gene_type:complete